MVKNKQSLWWCSRSFLSISRRGSIRMDSHGIKTKTGEITGYFIMPLNLI